MIILTHVQSRISIVTLTLGTFIVTASCLDILGPYNVHRDNITLSGFSSGGAMAQMFQFSYPSLFKGIAVFSHTFYRCGPAIGDIDEYDRFCTTLFNLTEAELYDTANVHTDIQEYLSKGLIEDPTVNLQDKRLYVYSGLQNVLFTPRQSFKILQVYNPYIQNPGAIKTRIQDATQVMPTDSYGGACNASAEANDFIANCGFSGATEAINWILFDDANATEAFTPQVTPRGNVSMFDQTEFTKDLVNHNMDDFGYYYIPTQCLPNATEPQQCFLHFYFHGCLTGGEFNGPRHVDNSGFLEVAERKGIIMVFPQAKSSVPNPAGCWDTFGVAGKYYATQQGPQVTALKRMVDKILSSPAAPVPVETPTTAPTTTTTTTTTAATTTAAAEVPPESSTKTVPASSRLSLARNPAPRDEDAKTKTDSTADNVKLPAALLLMILLLELCLVPP